MGGKRKFLYTAVSIILAAVILVGSIIISRYAAPVFAETVTTGQQESAESKSDGSENNVVYEETDVEFKESGDEAGQVQAEDPEENNNNDVLNVSDELQGSGTETNTPVVQTTEEQSDNENKQAEPSDEIKDEEKTEPETQAETEYRERVFSAVYLSYEYEDNGDGTVTITKYNGSDSNVVIPSKTGNKKVVRIGEEAFCDNETIKSVTFPSTVREIGARAFTNCESLETINWGGNEEKIEGRAFENTGIKELRLSSKLKEMLWDGEGSFAYCRSLEKVWIPKSLETAEDSFVGCENLTTVEFEDGLKKIPATIFINSGVESVIIPDSVLEIEGRAFENTGIKELRLPSKLKKMLWDGEGSFAYCRSLKKVWIPKSLETAEDSFVGCENLTTIEYEKGITGIPGSIFRDCKGLKTVTFPSTVTEIGAKAFTNCESLETINWGGNEEKIGGSAFENTGIKELRLPSKLKEMLWDGEGSFAYCKSLEKVWIPKSLETAQDSFVGCENLTTVEFEDGLKKIPATIFKNDMYPESWTHILN